MQTWLGHVDTSSTYGYVKIDMDIKRKALSTCNPVNTPEELRNVVNRHEDVIAWLEKM